MNEKKTYNKKRIKYDYSNPESQKLFEEFSILLADINEITSKREEYILSLEKKLKETTRIRNMVKLIIKKLVLFVPIIISEKYKEIRFDSKH